MKNILRNLLVVALASCVIETSYAQISIEQLVDQARISEGELAVRDHPRWNGVRKILIRKIGIDTSAMITANPDVEFVQAQSINEAMRYAGDVDAFIGFCAPELVSAAKKLIWVQIYHSGAEECMHVDEIAAGSVILTNMQKMSSPVIAEHAIAMTLSLARKLPQFVNAMDASNWDAILQESHGMMPVSGKNMLVLGLGGIGTEAARLGAALGMRVSAMRNSSRNGPDFVEYVGLSHELHELAAKADVVVSALPLTGATEGLLGEEFFAAIKPGAIFINVGRGKVVVTEALSAALESGIVSGAGLDVTDPEPLPNESDLWARDNVIITPHVAGAGSELERHAVLLQENLRRFVLGEPLLNVVDPKKGY